MKADFLSRYTPRLVSPEVLENIFVQRQELAQELVDRIRESALTSGKHHTLLTGPRGIGKTHLVSLVYHRICKMEDLRARLVIALLSEEEWSVTSFLDLLLCILEALPEESNNSKGEQPYPLTERIESLYEMPVEAAEFAGVALLKEFIGNSPNGERSASRTLLLLVENLDDLFAGLGKDGQKQLRTFLEENSCIVLATAQSYFKDVKQKNSPFYGFFCHEELKELKADDATQLLANIAKHNKNDELASFIQTQTGRDRIKAVHFLAGGNHRLYVIFSEFLTDHKSLDQLVEAFMRTLDDLTPYYQERMRFLSPQQRKIIDFLCDHRQAVTVKEIAQRCFMTHQTASSQLKKLLEMGYVRSEPIGRESYYELREPLMRFCLAVKKQRGEPIQLFVDFLRLWYTKTELQQRLELLSPDAQSERQYVLQALRAAKREEVSRIAAYRIDIADFLKKKDFIHALQVINQLVAIRDHAMDWLVRGSCLSELGREEEAFASFDKAIELDPNNQLAWRIRGLDMFLLERYKEAVVSLDKVIEFDPNDTSILYLRGIAKLQLKCYEEALVSFDKVIELDPNDALTWNMRGLLMSLLGWGEEAITSWDKAITLSYQSSDVFFNRVEALLVLNRWDEGIAALDDALNRFAHADEPNTGNTATIVRKLFNTTNDAAIWRSRIKTLIELYDKYQVISALGQGLVRSIPALMSEMISDKAAQTWLEVWRELTSDRSEFQIPLRLLNAAVHYRETKGDKRVLLELPIEERNLLKPLLGISEEG